MLPYADNALDLVFSGCLLDLLTPWKSPASSANLNAC